LSDDTSIFEVRNSKTRETAQALVAAAQFMARDSLMTASVGIGVGVIIRRANQVLLGRRLSAPGAGTWQFPGGKLDFGEDIEACAARETLEEAGIVVCPVARGPYTSDLFTAAGPHYVTLFVIADYVSGEPRAMEPTKCEGWSWHEWAAMPRPLFLPIENLLKQNFSPFSF
jgi:8-oxo-dGTP diphosphatase